MTPESACTDGSGQERRSAARRRALLFILVCSPLIFAAPYLPLPHPVVALVLLFAATLLFLRFDRRPASALGLEWTWRRAVEFLAGFGGGAVLILAMAVGARLVLPFEWVINPHFNVAAALFSLLYLFISNSGEELAFRGYGFDRLIAAIGHWRAQLVTALMFALFHVLNGWPWYVALIGTTAGSLLFGLTFVRWRSIPAAAGVHVAVNWVRDLLLLDPPTVKTLYAPLAPRPWTVQEQWLTNLLCIGLFLVACIGLMISIIDNKRSANSSAMN